MHVCGRVTSLNLVHLSAYGREVNHDECTEYSPNAAYKNKNKNKNNNFIDTKQQKYQVSCFKNK